MDEPARAEDPPGTFFNDPHIHRRARPVDGGLSSPLQPAPESRYDPGTTPGAVGAAGVLGSHAGPASATAQAPGRMGPRLGDPIPLRAVERRSGSCLRIRAACG